MNQNEFLSRLRQELYGLPKEEIHDIIQDYKEHFQVGLSKGKSEEEIARELGNPRTIAKDFINSNDIPRQRPVKKDNRLRNILIVILVIMIGLPILGLATFMVLFNVSEGPTIIEESNNTEEKLAIDIRDGDTSVQIGWDGIKVRDGNEEVNIGWSDSFDVTENELEPIVIDEEHFENIDGIDNITIASSFIDIEIIGQDRDDLKVNYHGKMEADGLPDLELEKSSDTIIIKFENPDNQPISVRNSNVTLQVFVPETYDGNYNIASSSGHILARDLIGNKFNIASSSGRITLDNLLGEIKTSSSSGNIDISSKMNEGDIDISTSSGNVLLTLGLESNYTINATTSSGRFRPSSNIDVISNRQGNFEANIGNGHNTINISNSSGDLLINIP